MRRSCLKLNLLGAKAKSKSGSCNGHPGQEGEQILSDSLLADGLALSKHMMEPQSILWVSS